MDRASGANYLATPVNAAGIQTVNLIYAQEVWRRLQAEDVQAAIDYGEAQLSDLDYLPRNPLYFLAEQLIKAYEVRGNSQRIEELRALIAQASHHPEDTLWEYAQSAEAQPDGSKCFIATAAAGSQHDQNVVVLRRWRDEVLCQSILGRGLVRGYEVVSPPLAWAVARSPWARLAVRRFVLLPAARACRARLERSDSSAD